MEKPIVFLSHSSRDKEPLAALKAMLDKRAAGSIEFFLSSDGESIRFGRNWVVRISDALSRAKLMFVFLSPHSESSRWIHFEAGCAYSKDIRVVPVCLPGTDLNQISAPLNLLQGFNLHSHEALGNIARTCNEVFDLKIEELFSKEEFKRVTDCVSADLVSLFGTNAQLIEVITVEMSGQKLPSPEFDPIPSLVAAFKARGLVGFGKSEPNGNKVDFEAAGCEVAFRRIESPQDNQARQRLSPNERKITPITYSSFEIDITLSSGLYHLNAPILTEWLKNSTGVDSYSVSVFFTTLVSLETRRHELSTKMHSEGMRINALKGGFEFEGLSFRLERYTRHQQVLRCKVTDLMDKRFPIVIDKAFESEALIVVEPNPFESF